MSASPRWVGALKSGWHAPCLLGFHFLTTSKVLCWLKLKLWNTKSCSYAWNKPGKDYLCVLIWLNPLIMFQENSTQNAVSPWEAYHWETWICCILEFSLAIDGVLYVCCMYVIQDLARWICTVLLAENSFFLIVETDFGFCFVCICLFLFFIVHLSCVCVTVKACFQDDVVFSL